MKRPRPPLHLEIQTHRGNPCGIIRSTFRKDGKIRHSTHGRITGLDLDTLKLIQAAFRGDVVLKDDPAALQLLGSKEYGASQSLLLLAQELGLPRILYSRNEAWVRDVMAMIVGRVIYAGSKLSLSHQWKNTALWDLCGVEGPVDVRHHCYASMDRLLERQPAIQKALAAKHLQNGALVLYDITSSYFEGAYEESRLVAFGYNRDGKRGHEQMVIGLLCSEQGCPVGVEVFAGNTQDASTVPEKIAEVQERYGLKELIFVGDRGMITQSNQNKLKGTEGLCTISALTHPQFLKLLERKVIEAGLFDEKDIVEVMDPEDPQRRYCLCRNPQSAERESRTRKELLEKTRLGLDKIAASTRAASSEKIGARVSRVLIKTKMGKFVDWKVSAQRLEWSFDENKIAAEKRFDGCYVVSSNVPAERMAKAQVVASYKKLSLVETAFRNLKTVQLEVRPVYHKTDDRIRAHVFLCVLAYYLQWHIHQRLRPLYEQDGEHHERQWTFEAVIARLSAIRRQRVRLNQVEFEQVCAPQADQQRILDLLRVKL
jgi:transposase